MNICHSIVLDTLPAFPSLPERKTTQLTNAGNIPTDKRSPGGRQLESKKKIMGTCGAKLEEVKVLLLLFIPFFFPNMFQSPNESVPDCLNTPEQLSGSHPASGERCKQQLQLRDRRIQILEVKIQQLIKVSIFKMHVPEHQKLKEENEALLKIIRKI